MKVTTHEADKYASVVADLTRRDDIYFTEFVEITSVVVRFAPEFLSSSELMTLLFLLGRTLMFRKRAEAIRKSHFLNGVTGSDGAHVCSGVGVAYSTLRVALEGLSDKGFVEIHAFLDKGTETLPRVYEVKTAKILENQDTEGVKNMLSRVVKTSKRQTQRADFEREVGGAEIHTPLCRNPAHIKDILRISKVSTSVDTPEPSTPARSGKKKAGSSRAHVCTQGLSAKEVAAQILGQSKARREQRASSTSVPTKKWDTKTLQALLDVARDRAGTTCPRIAVVGTAIATLHKRMKEHEVPDVVDFFSWAMANWSVVAAANRKAKAVQLRQKDTKAARSEMHLAPNFTDLAYRFPYFYKFYQDRRYTEAEVSRKENEATAEKAKVHKAAEAAASHRRAVVRERDIQTRDRNREEDEQFRQRRARRYRQGHKHEDDLPEYQAPEWKGQ